MIMNCLSCGIEYEDTSDGGFWQVCEDCRDEADEELDEEDESLEQRSDDMDDDSDLENEYED